ncbi:MAG: thioredoxin family protein, partial [bacterium]
HDVALDLVQDRRVGWGPRPAPAQEMVMEYKKTKAIGYDELTKNIQLLYLKDKTQTIQNEFIAILKKIMN